MLFESEKNKRFVSKDFNYCFDKVTGFAATWGRTKKEDPPFSPYGPMILDVECSEICHQGCSECYKSNTAKGRNMTLEQFRKILDIFPRQGKSFFLQQIAFGIGSIDGNPELFDLMWHCRNNGIIPNITINGYRMTDEYYDKLAHVAGAVAVSCYDKKVCFEALEQLYRWTSLQKREPIDGAGITLRQCNIHQILSEETYDKCMSLLDDFGNSQHLRSRLNAIVFLIMKPKGNRNTSHQLKDAKKYKALIDKAMKLGINFGFDSCSCPSFLEAITDLPNFDRLAECAEPCESTLFSLYVDVAGAVQPCSFAEGNEKWEIGINLLEVKDFTKEVWNHPRLLSFRESLLTASEDRCNNCRKCPLYNLDML